MANLEFDIVLVLFASLIMILPGLGYKNGQCIKSFSVILLTLFSN